MSVQDLSSRAIIGEFYARLEALDGMGWIAALSMLFNSDQESETYKWLGMVPAMREWLGARHAKGFNANGITIINKHYEATLEILVRDMRRDKTGQVFARLQDLAERTNSHWASLLSTLIINGESTACYDGQFFFDTDHSEGDSGTQDNDIQVDISALPVSVAGTATAPSVEEMQLAILEAIAQILGFVDNQGEPMNETAKNFLVMTPVSLFNTAQAATKNPLIGAGRSSTITQSEFTVTPVANPRLSAWTDQFAVFRTDGSVKPFIRQEETPVVMKAKAEGSEFEFDNDAHQYGVDAWRNCGYGYWQTACLAKMV